MECEGSQAASEAKQCALHYAKLCDIAMDHMDRLPEIAENQGYFAGKTGDAFDPGGTDQMARYLLVTVCTKQMQLAERFARDPWRVRRAA